MRKSSFVCLLCLTALFIFSDILQARGGRRGGRSDTDTSPSAADSNNTSASTLNPVSITAGKSVGNIVLGKSTKADIIREYGSNFKQIDHKKYSSQLIYKHLGLSVYWYQKDTSKKVFSIHIEPPFKAVTKKGITLGKSRLKDVFRAYGSRKATYTKSHQYYTYPGITFYATRGGSASEQKIIKIAVRKSAQSKMLSKLLNLFPISVEPLSYLEYAAEHVNAFSPVHISSDGTTFVTRSQKEKELTYYLWRVTEKSAVLQAGLKLKMSSFASSVYDYSAAFSGNGKYIAFSVPSAKYRHKKTVPIYDWNANRVFTVTVQAPKCRNDFAVRRIALNEDASKIAVCHPKNDNVTSAKEISVYNSEDGKQAARFHVPNSSVISYYFFPKFSRSGRYLLCEFSRNMKYNNRTKGIKPGCNSIEGLQVFDVRTGATVNTINAYVPLFKNTKELEKFLKKDNFKDVHHIAISPDDKYLAVGTDKGLIIKEIGKPNTVVSESKWINKICFGEKNQLLYTTYYTEGHAKSDRYLFDGEKLTLLRGQEIEEHFKLNVYSQKEKKWILIGKKGIYTVKSIAENQLEARKLFNDAIDRFKAGFGEIAVKQARAAIDKEPLLRCCKFTYSLRTDIAPNAPLKFAAEMLLYRYKRLMQETDRNIKSGLGFAHSMEDGTLSVKSVNPGGAAEQSGLKAGDIFVSINSTPVTTLDDYHRITEPIAVGTEVTVVVNRDGEELTLRVKTQQRIKEILVFSYGLFTIYEYGLLAAQAGHPVITLQAADEIRSITDKYHPAVKKNLCNLFAIHLEGLALAVQGKTDKAYMYIIKNDGIIRDQMTLIRKYVHWFPLPWKPFFRDRKKFAYILGIEEKALPKTPKKNPVPQPYLTLDGKLVQPIKKAPALKQEIETPVKPEAPKPKQPKKEKPKATVLD